MKRWYGYAACLMMVLLATFSIGIQVNAQSTETHFGRPEFHGYFKEQYQAGGEPLYASSLTIGGATPVDKVNDFATTLSNRLSSQPVQTSFIIYTMLGRDIPTNYTAATMTDVNELKTKLTQFVQNGGSINYNAAYPYTRDTFYQTNRSDVAWYVSNSTAAAYTFSRAGIDYYAIKQSSSSPIANWPTSDFSGLPLTASGWTMQGRSTVSKTDPRPGETITFIHSIKNNGPNSTNPTSVNYRAFNTLAGSMVPGSNGSKVFEVGVFEEVNSNAITIPNSDPDGKQYCQKAQWNPQSSTAIGWATGSTPACATVKTGFDITPNMQVGTLTALPGDEVEFNRYADNVGPSTGTDIKVAVKKITVDPGVNLDASWFDANTGKDCAAYVGGRAGVSCTENTIATRVFASNETWPGSGGAARTETVAVTGVPGQRICRVLSVSPYAKNMNGVRNSAVACVTISKSPYIALIGADSSAGGNIGEPCNREITDLSKGEQGFLATRRGSGANMFGSFTDYSLFAVGPIGDFSSSGRIDDPSYYRLSFSNNKSTATPPSRWPRGYFYANSSHCIDNYVQAFSERGTQGIQGATSVDWERSGDTTYYYEGATGIVELSSAVLQPNQRYLIYAPERTVRINDNITYFTKVNSYAEAPQLMIIAKNVSIRGAVERLDGVFFATNNFNTCAEAGPNPNEPGKKDNILLNGECSKQLTVNGAVIAFNTVLARTFGGLVPGQPSEIIRMRPEVFLQPYARASGSQFMVTDFETELPPRY